MSSLSELRLVRTRVSFAAQREGLPFASPNCYGISLYFIRMLMIAWKFLSVFFIIPIEKPPRTKNRVFVLGGPAKETDPGL